MLPLRVSPPLMRRSLAAAGLSVLRIRSRKSVIGRAAAMVTIVNYPYYNLDDLIDYLRPLLAARWSCSIAIDQWPAAVKGAPEVNLIIDTWIEGAPLESDPEED